MKTFIALSVFLNHVEDKYRGNNNNCQYVIIVRAKSKKEVARILAGYNEDRVGSIYHYLRIMGINETTGENHLNIPQKDNTIYFKPESTKSGYYDDWIEYVPQKKI